jgi:hypothetical protein
MRSKGKTTDPGKPARTNSFRPSDKPTGGTHPGLRPTPPPSQSPNSTGAQPGSRHNAGAKKRTQQPTEETTVTTDEYLLDWTRIRTSDEIKLNKDSKEIARGLADGVTGDGNTLWLIQSAGKGRAMFHHHDGILAFRTNP